MSDENKPGNPEEKKSNSKVVFTKNDEGAEDIAKAARDLNDAFSQAQGFSTEDLLRNVNEERRKRALEEKVRKKAPRLSHEVDPRHRDVYNGAWRKRKLLPDNVIKDVSITDSLVAAIVRARGNTMSMFGHIRRDRFDVGIEVNIKPELEPEVEPEQLEIIQARIDRFKNLLMNCGHTEGLAPSEQMSLPEFMQRQTWDGVRFGRMTTEIVYTQDPALVTNPNEQGRFHRFRPVDASTIYKIYNPKDPSNLQARKASTASLSEQGADKVEIPNPTGKLKWLQEIDGFKQQTYSDDEMVVFNFYPVNDVETNGYPITPLDTCVNSITTHISIEAYNKLFFQNGRGGKGILALKSDEADQDTIDDLKQQYMAGVNDVNNAFRTPMIAIGKDDDISWVGTESNAKDGEFAYLYDQIARNILSAFNMSPDELPGYGHLSRGTNSQTLSESNNDFKLTAARDTGLRPLIMKWEEFLNHRLFPLMDPELSQLCVISLSGLDAQSRDQEAVRLQQETGLHMTYDEVRKGVDKPIVGERMGGDFPFSERYQLIADKYLTAGELVSNFLKDPTARLDALLNFRRDPFALQYMQMLMQVNPTALQARMVTRDDHMEVMMMLLNDYLEEIGD